MLTFLSTLIVSGMICMGIGALIWMGLQVDGWLMRGVRPMWSRWKKQIGFTRLEFIERVVNEMTGTPSHLETEVHSEFGVASGCLAILLFIPMQVLVTPIGLLVLHYRRLVLRHRVQLLPIEQQNQLAGEYREWIGA